LTRPLSVVGKEVFVELESACNAAAAGLCEFIKQGKDSLIRLVHELYAGKARYSVQKEANLIKEKYMKQETAAQTIKGQLKSNIENEKIELKSKPIHGKLYGP
jgi:hypothetical protein